MITYDDLIRGFWVIENHDERVSEIDISESNFLKIEPFLDDQTIFGAKIHINDCGRDNRTVLIGERGTKHII